MKLHEYIDKRVILARTLYNAKGDRFDKGRVMVVDGYWRGRLNLNALGGREGGRITGVSRGLVVVVEPAGKVES